MIKDADMPKVGMGIAVVILILNILLPGSGTLVASCYATDPKIKNRLMIQGILSFLLCVCLIGWILSILFGVRMVMLAH